MHGRGEPGLPMDVVPRTSRTPQWCAVAAVGLALGLLGGCGKAPEPTPKVQPQVILIEPDLPPRPMKPELPPLFDDIERRTFQFF